MVIDDLKQRYSISMLCSYFNIPRSSYYKWVKNGRRIYKNFDNKLALLIKEIFDDSQKGYRYIRHQLKRNHNHSLNPKTVLRYMQLMGLKSPIRKKRFECCTQQEINKRSRCVCENHLDRNFQACRPLEKLVTDVSYIYHKEGRLYLSVIKDLYDNSIVAYNISNYNDNLLVKENLDMVFNEDWDSTQPCIFHADQGFQYTHKEHIKFLDMKGVTVSHSRKGNCYDNACCENFFSHLKSESLELIVPENEEDLKKRVEQYILWYNTDRPQDKLKGMTPFEFRSTYLN